MQNIQKLSHISDGKTLKIFSNIALISKRNSLRQYEPISVYASYYSTKKENKKVRVIDKPPGKVKNYLVKKYVGYLEKFENKFERKYPKMFKVYKLFKEGVRDFFVDAKIYSSVVTDMAWKQRKLSTFSRNELENYRQIPSDMIHVAPVLILSSLPFANYVVFPIAYFFPRQLLCRHFWTPEQRVEFAVYYLSRRIHHYYPILNYLEVHTTQISDAGRRKVFQGILQKLEQGDQPDVEEVLAVKPLFQSRPFTLPFLASRHKIHTWHLAKSMSLSTRISRLQQDISLIHHIDEAIAREGISKLSLEQLQQACFTRGLNAEGVDKSELIKYITSWTAISTQLSDSSLSLLLHCPVLLAYNRPSNKKYLLDNVDIAKKT